MEGRKRTIEVDEDVADALEKRAAERGVSLDAHIADLVSTDGHEIDLLPDELAELDERIAEWERDRLGVPAEDVIDWLKGSVAGRDVPFPKLRKY